MTRIIKDLFALAAVAGFVWMMCSLSNIAIGALP